jgi:Glycosyltransferase
MVVLEAMALGKAVVCTDVVPFAKDGFNALVVPKENPEDLSKAMKNLYENKALKEALSKNAYESSFSYSKERFCNKYKECIQNP